MSSADFERRTRDSRHLCAACRERKARFRYRGVVKADRDHTLCFQCVRAATNRLRARVLFRGVYTRARCSTEC